MDRSDDVAVERSVSKRARGNQHVARGERGVRVEGVRAYAASARRHHRLVRRARRDANRALEQLPGGESIRQRRRREVRRERDAPSTPPKLGTLQTLGTLFGTLFARGDDGFVQSGRRGVVGVALQEATLLASKTSTPVSVRKPESVRSDGVGEDDDREGAADGVRGVPRGGAEDRVDERGDGGGG